MPTPRKFCWLYRNKNTGNLALVQRPRRRASPLIYWLKKYDPKAKSYDLETMSGSYAVDHWYFSRNYEYVGRI